MTYIEVQSFVVLYISIHGYSFNRHYNRNCLVAMIAINLKKVESRFCSVFIHVPWVVLL